MKILLLAASLALAAPAARADDLCSALSDLAYELMGLYQGGYPLSAAMAFAADADPMIRPQVASLMSSAYRSTRHADRRGQRQAMRDFATKTDDACELQRGW